MSHPQQYTQHTHTHTRVSIFFTFDMCTESKIMKEINERRDWIVQKIVSINCSAHSYAAR